MTENEISKIIVECALEVHRTLGGPGLLESVYEEALIWELLQHACQVQRQVSLPIRYKGHLLASPLKINILVNDLVLIECKATAKYDEVFESQILTYLRLSGLKPGLVINLDKDWLRMEFIAWSMVCKQVKSRGQRRKNLIPLRHCAFALKKISLCRLR